ncbi:MAG: hypothetical protein JKY65_25170 [Planctomycetes bacterium]|nr:hypothetical protein [Planctomycetota bacterium]
MSVEFVRHSSTAEAWDKKFLNPRRLQCAHQPDLAATAIRGLLRCVEAACRATAPTSWPSASSSTSSKADSRSAGRS